MNSNEKIEHLARKVAARHNSFLMRRLAVSALVGTGLLITLASLFWVARGHAVPLPLPIAMTAIGALAALICYRLKRMQLSTAVIEADRFFELKDGLVTARHLAQEAPEAPTTRLQWLWLSPRLAGCDPKSIQQPFPRRLGAMAAILTIAALTLSMMPPSNAVLAAEKEARMTMENVASAKEALEEVIDELEKELENEEGIERPDMDEFRKMVREIEETGDRVEAARQFARIERKVRDASRALDQKRDEETIKLAAKELKKSQDTEARKLGQKLSQKELREAAKMLEKMAAKKIDAEKLKKMSPERKRALEQAKKDLAKMRAATKRLAAAGKQRQTARNVEGGQQMAVNGMESKMALEDMLAELDESAAQMEQNLDKLEHDPDAEWCDKCQSCNNSMQKMSDKLGKKLRKMEGKRMAQAKLDALRKALAQAQAQCQGQGQGSQPGSMKGGKKPGSGSSWAERKERDNSQDNGSLAQLKGKHGEGPSLSKIEDAESGTGVSGLRGSDNKQREFSRQMESFVERDDIPEPLKRGVRNYFESLQATTEP